MKCFHACFFLSFNWRRLPTEIKLHFSNLEALVMEDMLGKAMLNWILAVRVLERE